MCLFLLGSSGLARAESGPSLLALGYQRKTQGDLGGAARAFEQARAAGTDPQRVALELGYVSAAQGRIGAARQEFTAAAEGPDPVLAAQARRELGVLPGHLWAELYVDAYGWSRVVGGQKSTDLVPTVRTRAHVRPFLGLDLQAYVFAQGTRDLASRSRNAAGVPEIYADNYALTGAGVLMRFFRRQLGLFAQAGPAMNLMDDGRPRFTVDVRGGLFTGIESRRCREKAAPGARLALIPCLDLYGESVYVSRFDHNVISFVRGRGAVTWLSTGPLLFQWFAEGRVAADRVGQHWNNFADAGAGHRFRLLGSVPFDLQVGAHAGSLFGREARDPAPARKTYADLRVLGATYLEF
jgi:hypothetical protein